MVVLERMAEKIWYLRIKQAREGADAEDIANWFKQADSSRNPYLYREIPQELVPFFLYAMEKIEEFTASDTLRYGFMDLLIQILKDSSRRTDERVFLAIIELLTISFNKFYELKTYKGQINDFEAKKNTLNEEQKGQFAKLVELVKSFQEDNKLLINGPIQLKISDYMNTLDNLQDKLFPEYISMYNDVLDLDTVLAAATAYSSDDAENKDFYSSIYTAIFENLEIVKRDQTIKITMDHYLQKFMMLYASNATLDYPLRLGKDDAKIGWYDILLKNLPNYARYFSNNYDGYTILDTTILTAFRNYIESQSEPKQRAIMTSAFVTQLNDLKGKLSNVKTATDVYDYFHNFSYDNKQLFPTQQFRTDFDKKSGLFKEFTFEQYDAVGTCCFKQGFNFSAFLNLVREKQTKQDAIDSLHTVAPACKTEFLAVGLIPSPEVTIDLKDTSEEVIKQQQKQIMDAIKAGNLEEFKRVAGSIKLDFTDENGDIPIHLAIELDRNEILPYLLPVVSLSVKDKHGDTPLLHAIKKGNVDIVNLFSSLGNRAEVRTKDKEGKTAREIVENISESDARKAMLDVISVLERTSGDVVLRNLSKENVPAMVNRPADTTNITTGNVTPGAEKPPVSPASPPLNDPEPPKPGPEPQRIFNTTGQAEEYYLEDLGKWEAAKKKYDAWINRQPLDKRAELTAAAYSGGEGLLTQAAKALGLRGGKHTRSQRKRYATTRKVLKK
jgi:hypothetical protein